MTTLDDPLPFQIIYTNIVLVLVLMHMVKSGSDLQGNSLVGVFFFFFFKQVNLMTFLLLLEW